MKVFTINWHQYDGIYHQLASIGWYIPSVGINMVVFIINWHQYGGILHQFGFNMVPYGTWHAYDGSYHHLAPIR